MMLEWCVFFGQSDDAGANFFQIVSTVDILHLQLKRLTGKHTEKGHLTELTRLVLIVGTSSNFSNVKI